MTYLNSLESRVYFVISAFLKCREESCILRNLQNVKKNRETSYLLPTKRYPYVHFTFTFMKKNYFNKITAFLTAVLMLFNQLSLGHAEEIRRVFSQSKEVTIPSAGFALTLPPDLGTVQNLNSGTGPVLIHIQTAHGNYEAQKKIEAILHYLKETYGIKTLFLEGSAFKLQPDLLRFFPDDMPLTMEVADVLTKKALVKGSELFLLQEPKAQAYGIEDLKTYVTNGEMFQSVLKQKKQSEIFLNDMNAEIERLSSPYLNKNLRSFLKNLDDYETKKTISFPDWLSYLKSQAKENLKMDLTNPRYQLDWPMLLRLYKLKDFESKIDLSAYAKEKEQFLAVIARALGARSNLSSGIAHLPARQASSLLGTLPRNDVYSQISKLLSSPLSESQLPDPETSLLFEKLVSNLPPNFNFGLYPNVKLFIAHLILQSELKANLLFDEVNLLSDKISFKLAQTNEEKELLLLFKDYRLLQRLFALELTPEDYEALIKRKDEINPEKLISKFLEINNARRVKSFQFEHIEEIKSLFNKAKEFYRLAKERDHLMLENVESRLKETGETKAVIITGGFHGETFSNYLRGKGYNYALISPKISDFDGHDAYVDSILHYRLNGISSSTYESAPFIPTPKSELRQLGFDPEKIRHEVFETVRNVLETKPEGNKKALQFTEGLYARQFQNPRAEVRSQESELEAIVQELKELQSSSPSEHLAQEMQRIQAYVQAHSGFIDSRIVSGIYQIMNYPQSNDSVLYPALLSLFLLIRSGQTTGLETLQAIRKILTRDKSHGLSLSVAALALSQFVEKAPGLVTSSDIELVNQLFNLGDKEILSEHRTFLYSFAAMTLAAMVIHRKPEAEKILRQRAAGNTKANSYAHSALEMIQTISQSQKVPVVPIGHLIFINDVSDLELTSAQSLVQIANEKGIWVTQTKDHQSGHVAYLQQLKPGESTDIVLTGGKCHDCIFKTVWEITDEVKKGPEHTLTRITIPLNAINVGDFRTSEEKHTVVVSHPAAVNILKWTLLAHLAVSSNNFKLSSEFLSPAEHRWIYPAKAATWDITIQPTMRITLAENGNIIRELRNGNDTRHVILDFITSDEAFESLKKRLASSDVSLHRSEPRAELRHQEANSNPKYFSRRRLLAASAFAFAAAWGLGQKLSNRKKESDSPNLNFDSSHEIEINRQAIFKEIINFIHQAHDQLNSELPNDQAEAEKNIAKALKTSLVLLKQDHHPIIASEVNEIGWTQVNQTWSQAEEIIKKGKGKIDPKLLIALKILLRDVVKSTPEEISNRFEKAGINENYLDEIIQRHRSEVRNEQLLVELKSIVTEISRKIDELNSKLVLKDSKFRNQLIPLFIQAIQILDQGFSEPPLLKQKANGLKVLLSLFINEGRSIKKESIRKKFDELRQAIQISRAEVRVGKNHREKEYQALAKAVVKEWEKVYIDVLRLQPAVTVLGGARVPKGHPYYATALNVGRALAEAGFALRNGGANIGIMEASSEGHHKQINAKRGKVQTQLIRIILPFEQGVSRYADVVIQFAFFLIRKIGLHENILGSIALPGGYGTLDEVFEFWRRGRPLVLFGTEFWEPILNSLYSIWEKAGLTDQLNIRIKPYLTDSIPDTIDYIRRTSIDIPPHRISRDVHQRIKREMEDGILKLARMHPALVMIGKPHPKYGEHELDIAERLSNESNLSVRIASRGEFFDRIYYAAQENEWLHRLQAVLFVPDQKILTNGEGYLKGNKTGIMVSDESNHQFLLTLGAKAFAFGPGGVGTMNKAFDVLTVKQTQEKWKGTPLPFFFGFKFWNPFKNILQKQMLDRRDKLRLIGNDDLDLMHVVDNEKEILQTMLHNGRAEVRATTEPLQFPLYFDEATKRMIENPAARVHSTEKIATTDISILYKKEIEINGKRITFLLKQARPGTSDEKNKKDLRLLHNEADNMEEIQNHKLFPKKGEKVRLSDGTWLQRVVKFLRHVIEILSRTFFPRKEEKVRLSDGTWLQHPNIRLGYWSQQFNGIAMPYLEPFHKATDAYDFFIERQTNLTEDEFSTLSLEMTESVAFLHLLGFIHRDIKPQNFFMGENHPVLVDLNLAFNTLGSRDKIEGGTLIYTSDRQWRENPDFSHDVYSLGATLLKIWFGSKSYSQRYGTEILFTRLIQMKKENEWTDDEFVKNVINFQDCPLTAVIQKAMGPEPYQNAIEMAQAIREAINKKKNHGLQRLTDRNKADEIHKFVPGKRLNMELSPGLELLRRTNRPEVPKIKISETMESKEATVKAINPKLQFVNYIGDGPTGMIYHVQKEGQDYALKIPISSYYWGKETNTTGRRDYIRDSSYAIWEILSLGHSAMLTGLVPKIIELYDINLVSDVGEEFPTAAVLLEYVEGKTIDDYLHETPKKGQFEFSKEFTRLVATFHANNLSFHGLTPGDQFFLEAGNFKMVRPNLEAQKKGEPSRLRLINMAELYEPAEYLLVKNLDPQVLKTAIHQILKTISIKPNDKEIEAGISESLQQLQKDFSTKLDNEKRSELRSSSSSNVILKEMFLRLEGNLRDLGVMLDDVKEQFEDDPSESFADLEVNGYLKSLEHALKVLIRYKLSIQPEAATNPKLISVPKAQIIQTLNKIKKLQEQIEKLNLKKEIKTTAFLKLSQIKRILEKIDLQLKPFDHKKYFQSIEAETIDSSHVTRFLFTKKIAKRILYMLIDERMVRLPMIPQQYIGKTIVLELGTAKTNEHIRVIRVYENEANPSSFLYSYVETSDRGFIYSQGPRNADNHYTFTHPLFSNQTFYISTRRGFNRDSSVNRFRLIVNSDDSIREILDGSGNPHTFYPILNDYDGKRIGTIILRSEALAFRWPSLRGVISKVSLLLEKNTRGQKYWSTYLVMNDRIYNAVRKFYFTPGQYAGKFADIRMEGSWPVEARVSGKKFYLILKRDERGKITDVARENFMDHIGHFTGSIIRFKSNRRGSASLGAPLTGIQIADENDHEVWMSAAVVNGVVIRTDEWGSVPPENVYQFSRKLNDSFTVRLIKQSRRPSRIHRFIVLRNFGQTPLSSYKFRISGEVYKKHEGIITGLKIRRHEPEARLILPDHDYTLPGYYSGLPALALRFPKDNLILFAVLTKDGKKVQDVYFYELRGKMLNLSFKKQAELEKDLRRQYRYAFDFDSIWRGKIKSQKHFYLGRKAYLRGDLDKAERYFKDVSRRSRQFYRRAQKYLAKGIPHRRFILEHGTQDQKRRLFYQFEKEEQLSRAEVRSGETNQNGKNFHNLIEEILDKEKIKVRSRNDWAKFHRQFFEYFLEDLNRPPPKQGEDLSEEEIARSIVLRQLPGIDSNKDFSQKKEIIQALKDQSKAYNKTISKQRPDIQPQWGLLDTVARVQRVLVGLEVDRQLAKQISKSTELDSRLNPANYFLLFKDWLRALNLDKTYVYVPGYHIVGYFEHGNYGLKKSDNDPFATTPIIVARMSGLEASIRSFPELATAIVTNGIESVQYLASEQKHSDVSAPALFIHFTRPLFDPVAQYTHSSLATAILKKPMPELIPESGFDEKETIEFSEQEVLKENLTFDRNAPLEEKIEKIKKLLDLALNDRLLPRVSYAEFSYEGVDRLAKIIGRTPREQAAVKRHIELTLDAEASKGSQMQRKFARESPTQKVADDIRKQFERWEETLRFLDQFGAASLATVTGVGQRVDILSGKEGILRLQENQFYRPLVQLVLVQANDDWLIHQQDNGQIAKRLNESADILLSSLSKIEIQKTSFKNERDKELFLSEFLEGVLRALPLKPQKPFLRTSMETVQTQLLEFIKKSLFPHLMSEHLPMILMLQAKQKKDLPQQIEKAEAELWQLLNRNLKDSSTIAEMNKIIEQLKMFGYLSPKASAPQLQLKTQEEFEKTTTIFFHWMKEFLEREERRFELYDSLVKFRKLIESGQYIEAFEFSAQISLQATDQQKSILIPIQSKLADEFTTDLLSRVQADLGGNNFESAKARLMKGQKLLKDFPSFYQMLVEEENRVRIQEQAEAERMAPKYQQKALEIQKKFIRWGEERLIRQLINAAANKEISLAQSTASKLSSYLENKKTDPFYFAVWELIHLLPKGETNRAETRTVSEKKIKFLKKEIEGFLQDIENILKTQRPWRFYYVGDNGKKVTKRIRRGLRKMQGILKGRYAEVLFQPKPDEEKLLKLNEATKQFVMILKVLVDLEKGHLKLDREVKTINPSHGVGTYRYYKFYFHGTEYVVFVLLRWKAVIGHEARVDIQILHSRQEGTILDKKQLTDLRVDYDINGDNGPYTALDLPESIRKLVNDFHEYHMAIPELTDSITFEEFVQAIDAKLWGFPTNGSLSATRAEVREETFDEVKRHEFASAWSSQNVWLQHFGNPKNPEELWIESLFFERGEMAAQQIINRYGYFNFGKNAYELNKIGHLVLPHSWYERFLISEGVYKGREAYRFKLRRSEVRSTESKKSIIEMRDKTQPSEPAATLNSIFKDKKIDEVLDFGSGLMDWLGELKGDKGYQAPNWLAPGAKLIGTEKAEPTYSPEYERFGLTRENWPSQFKKTAERLGISILSSEEKLPNDSEFDLLHASFMVNSPGIYNDLDKYEDHLRPGGWVLLSNANQIIRREDLVSWLLGRGYQLKDIQIFDSKTGFPADYPRSFWWKEYRFNSYLIVAQKPFHRAETRSAEVWLSEDENIRVRFDNDDDKSFVGFGLPDLANKLIKKGFGVSWTDHGLEVQQNDGTKKIIPHVWNDQDLKDLEEALQNVSRAEVRSDQSEILAEFVKKYPGIQIQEKGKLQVDQTVKFAYTELQLIKEEGRFALLNPTTGQKYMLKTGLNTVGRNPDQNIFLESSSISKRHAIVIVSGKNEVNVYDLSSRNGTEILPIQEKEIPKKEIPIQQWSDGKLLKYINSLLDQNDPNMPKLSTAYVEVMIRTRKSTGDIEKFREAAKQLEERINKRKKPDSSPAEVRTIGIQGKNGKDRIASTTRMVEYVKEAVRRAKKLPGTTIIYGTEQKLEGDVEVPGVVPGTFSEEAHLAVVKAIQILKDHFSPDVILPISIARKLSLVESEEEFKSLGREKYNAYIKVIQEFFSSDLWQEEISNPELSPGIVLLDDPHSDSPFIVWRGPKNYALLSISQRLRRNAMRVKKQAFESIYQDKPVLAALLLRGYFRLFLRDREDQKKPDSRLDNPKEPSFDEEVAIRLLEKLVESSPGRTIYGGGPLDSYIDRFQTWEIKKRTEHAEQFRRFLDENPLPRSQKYNVYFFDRIWRDNPQTGKQEPPKIRETSLDLSEIEWAINHGMMIWKQNGGEADKISFSFILGFSPEDLRAELRSEFEEKQIKDISQDIEQMTTERLKFLDQLTTSDETTRAEMRSKREMEGNARTEEKSSKYEKILTDLNEYVGASMIIRFSLGQSPQRITRVDQANSFWSRNNRAIKKILEDDTILGTDECFNCVGVVGGSLSGDRARAGFVLHQYLEPDFVESSPFENVLELFGFGDVAGKAKEIYRLASQLPRSDENILVISYRDDVKERIMKIVNYLSRIQSARSSKFRILLIERGFGGGQGSSIILTPEGVGIRAPWQYLLGDLILPWEEIKNRLGNKDIEILTMGISLENKARLEDNGEGKSRAEARETASIGSRLYDYMRLEHPKLFLHALLAWNLILGREPMVASDLMSTLITSSPEPNKPSFYPGVDRAITNYLTENPFYLISGDGFDVIKEKFLTPLQQANVSKEMLSRLPIVSLGGLAIHHYEPASEAYRVEVLVDGIKAEHIPIVRKILNEMTEELKQRNVFPKSDGYDSVGLGFIEKRVADPAFPNSVSLHYLPPGKISGTLKQTFKTNRDNINLLFEITGILKEKIHSYKEANLSYIQVLKGGTTTIDFLTTDKGKALDKIQRNLETDSSDTRGSLGQQLQNLKKRFPFLRRFISDVPQKYFIFFGDNIAQGGNDTPAFQTAEIAVQVGAKKDLALKGPEGHVLLFSKQNAEQGVVAEYLGIIQSWLKIGRSLGLITPTQKKNELPISRTEVRSEAQVLEEFKKSLGLSDLEIWQLSGAQESFGIGTGEKSNLGKLKQVANEIEKRFPKKYETQIVKSDGGKGSEPPDLYLEVRPRLTLTQRFKQLIEERSDKFEINKAEHPSRAEVRKTIKVPNPMGKTVGLEFKEGIAYLKALGSRRLIPTTKPFYLHVFPYPGPIYKLKFEDSQIKRYLFPELGGKPYWESFAPYSDADNFFILKKNGEFFVVISDPSQKINYRLGASFISFEQILSKFSRAELRSKRNATEEDVKAETLNYINLIKDLMLQEPWEIYRTPQTQESVIQTIHQAFNWMDSLVRSWYEKWPSTHSEQVAVRDAAKELEIILEAILELKGKRLSVESESDLIQGPGKGIFFNLPRPDGIYNLFALIRYNDEQRHEPRVELAVRLPRGKETKELSIAQKKLSQLHIDLLMRMTPDRKNPLAVLYPPTGIRTLITGPSRKHYYPIPELNNTKAFEEFANGFREKLSTFSRAEVREETFDEVKRHEFASAWSSQNVWLQHFGNPKNPEELWIESLFFERGEMAAQQIINRYGYFNFGKNAYELNKIGHLVLPHSWYERFLISEGVYKGREAYRFKLRRSEVRKNKDQKPSFVSIEETRLESPGTATLRTSSTKQISFNPEIVDQILTPAFEKTFELRNEILPAYLFSQLSIKDLVRILSKLLGEAVYSERAGILPEIVPSQFEKVFGEKRFNPTVQFIERLKAQSSDSGHVILDSAWIENLIENSPRTLYILLSALDKIQNEKAATPLLAVIGNKNLLDRIVRTLQMEQTRFGVNGINWEEKLEAKHFLDLSRLNQLIKVISPDGINSYVQANDYGVVSLNSGRSELRISSVANFILNLDQIHEHDLTAVAFLVPALLKAAQLVKSVKDRNQQALILQVSIKTMLPGMKPQGTDFVIALPQYIQQAIISQHLVDAAA